MFSSTEFQERSQAFSQVSEITVICSAKRLEAVLSNLAYFKISVAEYYSLENLTSAEIATLLTSGKAILISVSGQHTLDRYRPILNRPHIFISESICWQYLSALLPIDFVPPTNWRDSKKYLKPSKFLDILENGFADNLATLHSYIQSREIADIIIYETALELFFRSQIPDLVPEFYNGTDYKCDIPIGATVVDCGACATVYGGQFVSSFLKQTGPNGLVYAFEPIADIYKALDYELADNFNVHIINAATWSHETSLRMVSNGIASRCLEAHDASFLQESLRDTEQLVPAVALDLIFDERKVDYIKMDVEGAEVATLRGASHILRRDKPNLAICLYHSPSDFLQIPEYLASLDLGYEMWIENNEGHVWSGTKLFAVASKTS